MDEVAKAAGVSQATVSRVVNGNPRVNLTTRRQVERTIERLGFVPNSAARTLVTRRSDSIGVLIPEPTSRVFGDPFFAQVLRGVSSALTVRHQKLVLFLPQTDEEETELQGYLGAGHVDGVIMYSLHGDDPLPEQLRRRGLPVVVGGRPPTGSRVSYVDYDNRGGARAATTHLVEIGRRVVATVSGPLDMTAAIDRLDGHRDALVAAGIEPNPELEAAGDFTQESGIRAMEDLLARRRRGRWLRRPADRPDHPTAPVERPPVPRDPWPRARERPARTRRAPRFDRPPDRARDTARHSPVERRGAHDDLTMCHEAAPGTEPAPWVQRVSAPARPITRRRDPCEGSFRCWPSWP
jgi:DNA-binding LacI/PurR family transcriptional regulator